MGTGTEVADLLGWNTGQQVKDILDGKGIINEEGFYEPKPKDVDKKKDRRNWTNNKKADTKAKMVSGEEGTGTYYADKFGWDSEQQIKDILKEEHIQ